MARTKKMWDELHPELNYFTEKYLRQQATYIDKLGHLLQTANDTNSNTGNSNVETNIQIEDTTGESNNIEGTETINDSNDIETPPLEQICHENQQILIMNYFKHCKRDSLKILKNTKYQTKGV